LCKAETTKEQHIDWFLNSPVFFIAMDVVSTFPQSEEEDINKAKQFDLIYAQLGYLYIVLPNAPRPIPFGQDKPGVSHVTDGLIGSMTDLNHYAHPSHAYGAHPYLKPYGGTSYYPPPTHQHSYPISPPPPMGGPSPVPMMHPRSQPSTSSTSTPTYNLSSSGSTSNSYMPYGSSPQNNPYFPFPSPPQPVSPPPGQPHVIVNFVEPSPIQQLQNFEQLNKENTTHLSNNSKKKGKKQNNNNLGLGGNNPQQNHPIG
jgi:hypothetical protein